MYCLRQLFVHTTLTAWCACIVRYGMHVAELSRELVGIAQDAVLSFLMWWRIALRAIISNGALREAKKFLAPHVSPELLASIQAPHAHSNDRVHAD